MTVKRRPPSDEDKDDDEEDEIDPASESAEEVVLQHLTPEQEKRYRYLLGESELFDRFVMARKEGRSPLDVLTSHYESHSMGVEQVRRHRREEKDEDAEMIEEAVEPESSVVFTESPTYVKNGTMRSYQVQGLNWLISLYEHGINGILADEMGLGKTLQTLSLLGYLKFVRGVSGPHLLVVPKSTLQNWLNESRRWVPELNCFILHGDKETRAQLIKAKLVTRDFDVCIVSYEICLIEKSIMRRIKWEYLIIDEAHRIKNEKSMLAQIVRGFNTKHRLLLTGTPLQNNLHELWALLNFLLPDIFASSDEFDQWFESHGSQDQDHTIQQLRKLLQPFLLRRLKIDVEHSLLPKKEVNLYVGMSEMQRQWYRRILERDIDAVNGMVKHREGKMRLLNIVMQLRKCCNHPYLFDGAEPGPPFTTDMHLIQNSGKLMVLDRLLERLFHAGSHVLLFSQMSRVLDILEDYCVFRGYKYCRIDGQTAHEDRIESIEEYNRPGSEKFIFLLTTRAGGLGINLATADIVILYDSDWNPQVDLQAQDRAHRIGQTKQVCVFRMMTENTIEEKILERALQKLRLDQLIIQQGKLTNANKALTQEEMLNMIRFGAEALFEDKAGAMSAVDEQQIEEILKRGEERTKDLMAKYQNAGIDDLQKFSVDSTVTTYQWEGEAFGAPARSSGAFKYLQPAKRERKANYGVDGYFREALRLHPAKPKSAKAPMPKNAVTIHDFQFYPPKLRDLLEREILAFQRSLDYQIPENPDEDEDKRADREQEQSLIDQAVALSEREQREKDRLLEQGFGSWTKKDYNAFLRGCEKYGRDNLDAIASEVEGKSIDKVQQYSKVFWRRYTELPDHDKIASMAEKAETRIQKIDHVQTLLSRKVGRSATFVIPYHGGKGKQYTEEEDRFILLSLERNGYGREDVCNLIHAEVLQEPAFRFDWFIKTRTPAELARRCQKLITFIERESKELEEKRTPKKGVVKSKLRKSITGLGSSPVIVSKKRPKSSRKKR